MSFVRGILKSYLAEFSCSTVHPVLMLILREIQFSFLQSWTLAFIIGWFYLNQTF